MKKIIILLIILCTLTGSLTGCNGLNGTPDQPFESFEPSVTGSAMVSDATPKASNPQQTRPLVTPYVSLAPNEPSPVDNPSDTAVLLKEDGIYTTGEDVGLYIHQYGRLPQNFITKQEARKLGWEAGSLEPYAPDHCIGGDRFGNYEGLLPEKDGRTYTECDIDTLRTSSRGAKRIVFSNDGLVYYTDDHYESFILLW